MKIKVKLPSSKDLEFLVKGTKATFGRSSKADISVPDESLSRIHAELEMSNDELFVTDLGSANGVYLGDVRILPNVRTSFTSYQELLIGHLEVQIIPETDINDEKHSYVSNEIQTLNEKETTGITKTKKVPLIKELPKSDKKTSSKKFNPFPLIVILVLTTGLAYKLIFKTKSSLPETIRRTSSPSNNHLNVPDFFLSLSEYETLNEMKSCAEKASCESLTIDVANGEGLSFKEKEVIIFFRPDLANKIEKFKRYTKEDASKLIAIYLTLKSDLFVKLQEKNLGQIHVVLKNQDQAIIHVFRFHTSRFGKTGIERSLLLTDLVTALKSGSSNSFWITAKSFIESKEF
jgi:pSer/pThr/pTyr-binding forkhead associated (FHA) protein